MKKAIAIVAAGLMSFGAVDTAFAGYALRPLNTKFTGTGTTSATKNGVTLKCNAKFEGSVNGQGVGEITGGSFTGELGCTSVGLQNLPWKSTATSMSKVQISGAEFTSPIGNCGPGNLSVTLRSGVVSFSNLPLKGGCTVSGNLKTSPTLKIVSVMPTFF
ncbi:MAG TPA: hypothetical protein VNX86_13530 [Rhizomicrobium sp.]|nr:hypothetical protein [Rhizomicrobium sp.]